ncbi:MAG: glucose-1-phosphate thymidylyltransferase [Candidatus Bathyarchaeota archaeon]|nr:glucose-1-phosphate thymidylyltransferase [Candidatus Bathyarchaeota archaeon]
MKGIILAAGRGTRLRPLTHTGPKHLLPLAGRPIISYGISKLKEIGLAEIGVVVGYRADDIRGYLKDGTDHGVKVHYILQQPQKGIAHALKFAEQYVANDRFVVYLGDNLLKQGLKQFADKFERGDFDAFLLLSKVRNPERFGVAVMDGEKVVELVEKPRKHISDLALVGIYFLKPVIFKAIRQTKPSWRNELEITDAIQWLIDRGYNVQADIVEGWWADTGTELDLLEANYLLLEDLTTNIKVNLEGNVKVVGKVRIEEGTEMKPDTTVRGPAYIGKNCLIENAAIRPFTSIGDNCEIKNTEIEHSIVIDNCRICCRRRIVDSIIGKNSIVLSEDKKPTNGCRLIVGENSKIYI